MYELIEMLKRHEGFRQFPYKCTVGKLTIGYGRNLTDNGITPTEAYRLLINDIGIAEADLRNLLSIECRENFPTSAYRALLNMMFNLGLSRFKGFKKMIAAIKEKDWNLAADEMLDSKWAKQVGQRAIELAEMVRNG